MQFRPFNFKEESGMNIHKALSANNMSISLVTQALVTSKSNVQNSARHCIDVTVIKRRVIHNLSILARNKHILIALFFFICMSLVSWGAKHAVAATAPVK